MDLFVCIYRGIMNNNNLKIEDSAKKFALFSFVVTFHPVHHHGHHTHS